jgi:hypothetical protein
LLKGWQEVRYRILSINVFLETVQRLLLPLFIRHFDHQEIRLAVLAIDGLEPLESAVYDDQSNRCFADVVGCIQVEQSLRQRLLVFSRPV